MLGNKTMATAMYDMDYALGVLAREYRIAFLESRTISDETWKTKCDEFLKRGLDSIDSVIASEEDKAYMLSKLITAISDNFKKYRTDKDITMRMKWAIDGMYRLWVLSQCDSVTKEDKDRVALLGPKYEKLRDDTGEKMHLIGAVVAKQIEEDFFKSELMRYNNWLKANTVVREEAAPVSSFTYKVEEKRVEVKDITKELNALGRIQYNNTKEGMEYIRAKYRKIMDTREEQRNKMLVKRAILEQRLREAGLDESYYEDAVAIKKNKAKSLFDNPAKTKHFFDRLKLRFTEEQVKCVMSSLDSIDKWEDYSFSKRDGTLLMNCISTPATIVIKDNTLITVYSSEMGSRELGGATKAKLALV